MVTLLSYFGGKASSLKYLLPQIPHHTIYVEPFSGGASVLLNKEKSKVEVYNDVNKEMVNLFKMVRERPEELERYCYYTPYARDEIKDAHIPTDNPLERARRVLLRSQYAMNTEACNGLDSNKSYFVKGKNPKGMRQIANRLNTVCERLLDVTIENTDALELMQYYEGKEDVFLYIDPPYVAETRRCGAKKHKYTNEIDLDYHKKILEFCIKSKHKIMISGYNHNLYNEMLSGWNRKTFEARDTSMSIRQECIWMNYEKIKDSLF